VVAALAVTGALAHSRYAARSLTPLAGVALRTFSLARIPKRDRRGRCIRSAASDLFLLR
jgi:hypothetical protein